MIIREVHDDLVYQVRRFLSSRKEFEYREDWDPIFNYSWKLDDFPYGYAILQGSAVVGFLGTLFSERVIRGEKLVYCNLCTWIVDDESKGARSLAAALLFPVMKMKEAVITCYTANAMAQRCFDRLGFKRMDIKQIVISTIPGLSVSAWRDSLQVSLDPNEIEHHLNDHDLSILNDHRDLTCTHFLIRDIDTDQYCYGIGTTSALRRRFLSGWKCFNICYLSDAAFFAEKIAPIKKHLRKERTVALLRYDSRLIWEHLSSLEYKMPTVRLSFGADRFNRGDIDNLYSELVTYNKY
jgi:hypothetical protein